MKIFLDRATELQIAGNRPSAFAKIKVGGKKDGTITVWQSDTWATGGFAGGGQPPLPYVYSNIPNTRLNHVSVSVNAGPAQRLARAQQPAGIVTSPALPSKTSPPKSAWTPWWSSIRTPATPRAPNSIATSFKRPPRSPNGSKLWKPRGSANRRGHAAGLASASTPGAARGHACTARTTINPDGSVLVEMGTQDLGTGTRTIMTQVAAETLGLQMGQIKLVIGDNSLPPGGSSGGSTTVGGASSATRKSGVNALAKLFEAAAPALGAQPEDLEAVDGTVRVKGDTKKSMTWVAACKKIGPGGKISETGANEQRNPMGLNSGGAAGVQVADV